MGGLFQFRNLFFNHFDPNRGHPVVWVRVYVSQGRWFNSLGWPLVSLMVLMIAASMAELASAYPTAGGLYFWAYRLGGRRWGLDHGPGLT